ncbi:MAG TPA: aspartyl protease family protein [Candidatus Aquilonibacter sp.]|nr:aspartyl protease family protein [Candidatus Aquilonibacter sp.]
MDEVPPANPASTTANAITPVSPSLRAAIPAVRVLRDAVSLYRRGNLAAAIEKYRLILLADPSSPEAHAGMARIYLKQGNVDEASETVREGLNFSNSPDLRVALGEVYFRQGRIPEAEQEWLNVVNSGSPNARAYLGLAHVQNARSLYGQGKVMIAKARALDAVDPDIELNWNMTLPLAERIRRLESYLASPEDGLADDRAKGQEYLDYLKMLQRAPQGSCQVSNPLTETETSLVPLLADSEHLRGYGLKVNLNGRKSTLMLDTGASGILISRKTAEKAGIKPIAAIRIGGVGDGGAGTGYIGLASVIKIGDLEIHDCPVRVLDKRSVLEDEGVIGTDLFEPFLVNIDFPSEKLRLIPLPTEPDGGPAATAVTPGFHDAYSTQEMKSYTKVYRFRHYLLVPTKVGRAADKLFLLDTGGFVSQITPALARQITRLTADSEKIVRGISGSVNQVYSAEKTVLEFGNLRQEDQDLTAFDLSSASQSVGTEISGTLGFETLRGLNIKIDYRDGLVHFHSELARNRP